MRLRVSQRPISNGSESITGLRGCQFMTLRTAGSAVDAYVPLYISGGSGLHGRFMNGPLC